MKTKRGIKEYKLPEYSSIWEVFISGKDYNLKIEKVNTLPFDDLVGIK